MPVFKVWNLDRSNKKSVVASSVEDVISKGAQKLGLDQAEHTPCQLVLEEDGTLVDEDEVLIEYQTKILILLSFGENWRPCLLPKYEEIGVTSEPAINNQLEPSVSTPCQTTSSAVLEETSSRLISSSKKYTVPLPKLSAFVEENLKSGRILPCFSNLITECANYYIHRYPLTTSSQYQEVGEQLFHKFPCIRFPKGAEPWTHFCEKLSQKMRNMRFNLKRKSSSSCSEGLKKAAFSTLSSTASEFSGISEDDLEHHKKEIKEEMLRPKPNPEHIKLLLRETYNERRKWLTSQPAGCWSSLLEEYPCFQEIEFIIYEYCLQKKKNDLSDEGIEMEKVFRVLAKQMEKKPEGTDAEKEISLIRFLERSTAFDKGKGKKSESIITVKIDVAEADIEKQCSTKELTPPRLICFLTTGNQLIDAAIIGDGQTIFCKADSILMGLLYTVIVYYVTDLSFPRQYSQILGLLQQYVIKEQFNCNVSGKFMKTCHLLDSAFSN